MEILILGAASDLAVALAHRFAQEKYTLTLAARNLHKLEPIAADLKIRENATVKTLAFDAREFAQHPAFADALQPLPDVVICVFGYLGDHEKAMKDWDEAGNIIESNYTGAVSILNLLADRMMQRGSGTIIGISSVAGERGRQSNYIYGSAKAGFSAYLSGLRNRCYHAGVHVMTVKPGFMKTAMTEGMPLNPKLTATPAQAANAIYKAFRKKKNTVFVLWMWKYIMQIIRSIPEWKFKKMKL